MHKNNIDVIKNNIDVIKIILMLKYDAINKK